MEFPINDFIQKLQKLKLENCFNPYTDICEINDTQDSPKIRTNNFKIYLKYIDKARFLILGEAPGYLGCRRTGLSFTDNRHLPIVEKLVGIKGLKVAVTQGRDKERSAKYIWEVLSQLKFIPFVYNMFPLHPHKPNEPLTNRKPKKSELKKTNHIIKYLLENSNFKEIFAIGRVAQNTLSELGYQVKYIRHPAQGGHNIFREQMSEYFEKK